MKSRKQRFLFLVLVVLCATFFSAAGCSEGAFTDLVVLSTTDMHGKCWETNLLTGDRVTQNMLRVSTAVEQIRASYGPEQVILIDNGDLFQGTPISEDHLLRAGGSGDEPEAMALCLREIGYDALVLGNHEFNYPWATMRRVYDWLEENGVRVLAANACYDGTDGVHQRGENAFGTYIVREITVNGHPHKVGVLGLENTDITRWDIPDNYPGILFAHPDNPNYDLSLEAARYISRMREDGCEIIIVSYHGGLGSADGELAFGLNSDHQGMRILRNTDSIDLLILGHDHSTAYSGTTARDLAGREVLIVNGGGQELTQTVFRLSEDARGGLVCEEAETKRLNLGNYQPDPVLQEKIRPYAEQADALLDLPVGFLTGEWDGSRIFHTVQSDAVDLINAAIISRGTAFMREKFGSSGLKALQAATGLDHLDVDASISNPAVGDYIPQSGPISIRDIYRLCRYTNEEMILPMYGRDLLSVMEENASQRLTCRVIRGKPYFMTINDTNTNLVFGGINFRYDMSKPAGERVVIDGFANGRAFLPDELYLVAVNNYIVGNDRCGLRSFSADDALWSQWEDENAGKTQDLIRDYIVQETERAGGVSPEAFNWSWSLVFPEDPAALPAYEGRTAAVLADRPLDGHAYVLYQEAQGCTLTDRPSGSGLQTVEMASCGDALVGALPEDALIFTVREEAEGLLLIDQQGRYLSCGGSGSLLLTNAPSDNGLSLWQPVMGSCGFYIRSVGCGNNQVLEYYGGKVSTYSQSTSDRFVFNFYEVKSPSRPM
ncbi:MAG: bifunctional metallophosphatase/5'-nucleotidase [Clostridia bacterium]|nr:bifunctional metallophosphatase/5'-nucleotidase [Clostridia bacterium]